MVYAVLGVLGLIFGSFSNSVIYRLPRSLSFVRGKSKCPKCGTEIKWYDLVPIVSIVLLRFRCRQCRQRISLTYPVVELLSAVGWLLSYFILSDYGFTVWLYSIFLFQIFLIIAAIDFFNYVIPDSLIIILFAISAAFGILARLSHTAGPFGQLSLYSLLAAAVMAAPLLAAWLVTRGKGIGLGDVKLAAVAGFIFGVLGGLITLYLAFILGAVASIVLLIFRKANLKTRLPFGSFLGVAAIAYIFLGVVLRDFVSLFFR
ncbi:MAG: leader peptidase (prepilin peptidase) / N-methyltransferase [Parcubacteria group bacterium Licking1014_17]|nr:MAG: leader peptidase (prepilin peptidase) / N-methyltransferase [Parcubacteria group bacterium Licking1014_17]